MDFNYLINEYLKLMIDNISIYKFYVSLTSITRFAIFNLYYSSCNMTCDHKSCVTNDPN